MQENQINQPAGMPTEEQIQTMNPAEIAAERDELASDLQYAQTDRKDNPDAVEMAKEGINHQNTLLSNRENELASEAIGQANSDQARLAEIRRDLAKKAEATIVMGPDGQPMTLGEIAEHNQAVSDGALDRV